MLMAKNSPQPVSMGLLKFGILPLENKLVILLIQNQSFFIALVLVHMEIYWL